MNLFDRLINTTLDQQPHLSPLRIVVEKELLHHDILRILSHHHLLTDLTFIGGTALRICHGGVRLSEDLDFTGGHNFSHSDLATMGEILTQKLNEKYGLEVSVSEPQKVAKNVATWKIKIITQPAQKHLPTQRINIDICTVPSYTNKPMMLLNPYHIDMGTNGLIIQAQSKEEIYTDKLLAFAFRPNRIKYRDLWDILWLYQQSIHPHYELIDNKLTDRQLTKKYFLDAFNERLNLLLQDPKHFKYFKQEMSRFLPSQNLQIIQQNNFWAFLLDLLKELVKKIN